jgi:hypothetical protein
MDSGTRTYLVTGQGVMFGRGVSPAARPPLSEMLVVYGHEVWFPLSCAMLLLDLTVRPPGAKEADFKFKTHL